MLIGVGIMVAIGFSGVFTYGSMVNSPDSSNQGQQEIEAKLPEQNFSNQSFELSIRQQAYLSVTEEVVFVNAFYNNGSSVYKDIQDLLSTFENRVYVNMINRSDSTIGANYEIDVPSALIVGDQPSQRRPYTMQTADPNRESIQQGVCSAMRNVTQFGATCFS